MEFFSVVSVDGAQKVQKLEHARRFGQRGAFLQMLLNHLLEVLHVSIRHVKPILPFKMMLTSISQITDYFSWIQTFSELGGGSIYDHRSLKTEKQRPILTIKCGQRTLGLGWNRELVSFDEMKPSGKRFFKPSSLSSASRLARFSRADGETSFKRRRISKQHSWMATSGSTFKDALLKYSNRI